MTKFLRKTFLGYYIQQWECMHQLPPHWDDYTRTLIHPEFRDAGMQKIDVCSACGKVWRR